MPSSRGTRDLRAQEHAVERRQRASGRRDPVPPWRSSLHQVAEDAFEIRVERDDLEQASPAVARGRRQRAGQRARVARVDLERASPSRRTPTTVPASSSAPASSRGRSVRTRTRSGRSSISARSSWKSPAAASRPWDMTRIREPNRSTSSSTWLDTSTQRPSLAEPAEQLDHVGALARVEPGQRLVQDEHLRVVDERLRDLDALPHPLRVRGQLARVGRVELDALERARGRRLRDRRVRAASR